MTNDNIELEMMTKKEFDNANSLNKFKKIEKKAQKVINQAKNDLDILALKMKEGSSFTILDAKLINEENENNFLELLKDGIDSFQ